MIVEAYDKGMKYKVGMQTKLPKDSTNWYIVNITCDKSDKMTQVTLADTTLKEFCVIRSFGNLTLTGVYEPDILKLARKLANKEK